MLTYIDPHTPYSLYIHVPFCRKKCSYCAFYSVPEQNCPVNQSENYMGVLLQELQEVVSILRRPFETIYIGGGDPGILQIEDLSRILSLSHTHGSPNECTMEINPNSLSQKHEVLFEKGLNRISMGIQSMQERHLAALGRLATPEENIHALSILNQWKNENGIGINVDLMTCIPGQSISDALLDIDTVIQELSPDHISLYNLTIEEGTPLAYSLEHGTLHVPHEDEQYEMLHACWNHLETYGFEHYEISNFSRSRKTRSKHNERYWNLQNYIGLGPSAAGTMFVDSLHALRTHGVPNLDIYAKSKPFEAYEYEKLGEKELIEESLLVGLRTSDGILVSDWNKRFGKSFMNLFSETLNRLQTHNAELMRIDSNHVALTQEGFMLLDSLVLSFIQELEEKRGS